MLVATLNGEQRSLLGRRLRAAFKQQPEIKALRKLLLAMGGIELVAPFGFDPDIPALIAAGFAMEGSVECEVMESSACHENITRLWIAKTNGLVGIGTGYALSEDGLWRQHSWGLQRNGILETTIRRVKYFGISLQGQHADSFAKYNC
jgi:hypothetical protein